MAYTEKNNGMNPKSNYDAGKDLSIERAGIIERKVAKLSDRAKEQIIQQAMEFLEWDVRTSIESLTEIGEDLSFLNPRVKDGFEALSPDSLAERLWALNRFIKLTANLHWSATLKD